MKIATADRPPALQAAVQFAKRASAVLRHKFLNFGNDYVLAQVDKPQPGAGAAYVSSIAILLVITFAFLTFSKNLFIDNAVVFHDEYVYKVSADQKVDSGVVTERQLAPPVPNRLFLSAYGVGSHFGSNYYVFAQLLNVVFWSLGLLVLYWLALFSGLPPTQSLIFLAAAALLPISAYTKYFMPESMYFAMFCVSAWALITGAASKKHSLVLLAGLLAGLMYFVKPHALALIFANAWFLMFLRGGLRLNVAFGTGAIVAIAAGKLVLSAPGDNSAAGLGVYEQMLDTLASKLAVYSGQLGVLANDSIWVAAGHALFLLNVFFLSFYFAIAGLIPKPGLRHAHANMTPELKLVSLYLLITSAVLVSMAVVFTVLTGEFGRVHSRYYFFLYPVALLMLFHIRSIRLTRGGKLVGLVIVVTAAISMLLWAHAYSEILPISLVSDSPEWGFVFLEKKIFATATVAFALASILALVRPDRTGFLISVVCVTSVLSSIDVVVKQRTLFRGAFVTGREAVAVEEIVGRSEMHNAVIVGENRDLTSKFLFFLTSTPNVEHVASGADLEHVASKYPQATRIIAISSGYQLPSRTRCESVMPSISICSLDR